MEEKEGKDNQKQQRIVLLRLQQVLRAKQEELMVLEGLLWIRCRKKRK